MANARRGEGQAPVALPTWVSLALVLGAGALARPEALRAPFFADDWLFLDQARARSLFATLASPDPIGNFARPLGRQVWFWGVGMLGGESSLVFHLASMAVFLAAVAMLFLLARRFAGTGAGVVAAGFFAMHPAADVPLTWACGSQDLLAVAFGIGAILAFVRGRRFLAAVLLLLGLLAKETVVLLPIPAAFLARRPGEPWRETVRRAWPFLLAWAAWAGVAALAASRGKLAGAGTGVEPMHLLAVLAGLARTVAGLEWRTGSWPWVPFSVPTPWLVASIALVVVAAWWGGERVVRPRAASVDRRAPSAPRAAVGTASSAASTHSRRTAWVGGVAWALTAGLPVVMVAPIWSSYYYLFAMAGTGLALGAWLGRRPTVAVWVVALLAVSGHQARALPEFQTGRTAWSNQSHVNPLYLRRGMQIVAGGLRDLRRLHPTLPRNSTVFFAGLPPFAAFQVGDGPLLRGAYRDTSLRAYYLSDFNAERAARGASFFIMYKRPEGVLEDQSADPVLLMRIALGQMLNDHPVVADVAMRMHLQKHPDDITGLYWSALLAVRLGQPARADSMFARAGMRHEGPADRAVAAAAVRLAARDTAGAMRVVLAARDRHVRDPRLHEIIADVYVPHPDTEALGDVEAFAALALAPRWPPVWRRWALCQLRADRLVEAARSLDRYLAMQPDVAKTDPKAMELRDNLARMLPGGDLAQAALRKGASAGARKPVP